MNIEEKKSNIIQMTFYSLWIKEITSQQIIMNELYVA